MGDTDSELVSTNINLRAYQRRFFDARESLNRSGVIRDVLDREIIPNHHIPPEHRPATEDAGVFGLPEYQQRAIREYDIDVREVLIEAIDEELPDDSIPPHQDGQQAGSESTQGERFRQEHTDD